MPEKKIKFKAPNPHTIPVETLQVIGFMQAEKEWEKQFLGRARRAACKVLVARHLDEFNEICRKELIVLKDKEANS